MNSRSAPRPCVSRSNSWSSSSHALGSHWWCRRQESNQSILLSSGRHFRHSWRSGYLQMDFLEYMRRYQWAQRLPTRTPSLCFRSPEELWHHDGCASFPRRPVGHLLRPIDWHSTHHIRNSSKKYYYETRFMFAFEFIALFFTTCALVLGLLALCSRIGSFLDSALCSVALFFQTITAALMT